MRLVFVVLVGMVLLGCGTEPTEPSQSASPTTEPTATTMPSPELTTPIQPDQDIFVPRDTASPPRIPLEMTPVAGMMYPLDEHFDDVRYWNPGGRTAPFVTGDFWFGESRILDDALVMYPPADAWFWLYPTTPFIVRDGVIQAEVTVGPDGYAGLVARASRNLDDSTADDTRGMYLCTTSHWGDAGCYVFVGNQWTTLFERPNNDFIPRDSYTLTLTLIDEMMEFRIDGRVVGTIEDGRRNAGSWGVYARGAESATTRAVFDYVTIAEFPKDYSLSE